MDVDTDEGADVDEGADDDDDESIVSPLRAGDTISWIACFNKMLKMQYFSSYK